MSSFACHFNFVQNCGGDTIDTPLFLYKNRGVSLLWDIFTSFNHLKWPYGDIREEETFIALVSVENQANLGSSEEVQCPYFCTKIKCQAFLRSFWCVWLVPGEWQGWFSFKKVFLTSVLLRRFFGDMPISKTNVEEPLFFMENMPRKKLTQQYGQKTVGTLFGGGWPNATP